MIIDISFDRKRNVRELVAKTIKFLNLDYESPSNQYICSGPLLFDVKDQAIHISSIYETDEQIVLVKDYITCLFKNEIIGLSSIGFGEQLLKIPNVHVYDITPQTTNISNKESDVK